MKKMTLLFAVACGLLLVGGCSDNEPVSSLEQPASPSAETSRCRSLEDAMEYADDWFSQMGTATRSTGRRIKDVEYLTTASATRSSVTDTIMYLVNFENGEGFALLGRPAGSRPIYAISDEGRLLMSDTVYNKGLAEFITAAQADALSSGISPNSTIDITTVFVPTRKVTPKLDEKVAKWDQTAPYNQYCPMVEDTRGVVGCGPVAVGMLMAYYRWPEKMDGAQVPWTAIVDNNDMSAIARFLENLAAPKYLNAQYLDDSNNKGHKDPFARGIFASSVVPPTFKALGYDVSAAWNYDKLSTVMEDVFNFMQVGYQAAQQAPVLMRGSSLNDNVGHIWVVDGFIEGYYTSKPATNNPIWGSTKIPADPMLHVVWGWGGYGNGYYTYFKDTDTLSEDPKNGPIVMNIGYRTLRVFGRYSKP